MSRPRYELFTTTATGNRSSRWISEKEVIRGLARGSMREYYDEFGRFKGYELIDVPPPTDESLPSLISTASISSREVLANAGLMGRSRTAGLREDERLTRRHPVTGHRLPAEDFVERSQEKVKLWTQPAPGRGDRAVRVYPKTPQGKA